MVHAEFFANGRPTSAEMCERRFLHAALSRGIDEEEAGELWECALGDDWRGAQARDELFGFGIEIVLH